MLSTKRVRSLSFSSNVRNVSVKRKVSTTMPWAFEKASAVTMFMPQAASAPAMEAKSMGRSRVTRVSSLSAGAKWKSMGASGGPPARRAASSKWVRTCSGVRVWR